MARFVFFFLGDNCCIILFYCFMRVISFPPLASPRQRSNDLVFIDRIQHVLKGDAILFFFAGIPIASCAYPKNSCNWRHVTPYSSPGK